MVKMKKPEKHEATHWIFGVDVLGKDIIEVPEYLVSLFEEEGFTRISDEKPKKEREKERG
ncbi:hypothetical protein Hydth_0548 [Hydrogenobacter thermophilus TK-6]|uniref:Uncharacterized protein n=1 Tax=Hydrogenobacter thermophilus (strain DSM 6534 / IAM 12695 / TK-6) TaxID=608538 RepID=D3DGR0_HYDTT|nr:hypothetical protein [Hydrogenobacter thermophilus]ADO44948.1 hypothetical protein Hydth_0548 [Hydrogenobacter thermophilus TK-6]BAI69012.1 hypothetical protein HTH_0550 [Hydrogenobacter thermophilus TK-6]